MTRLLLITLSLALFHPILAMENDDWLFASNPPSEESSPIQSPEMQRPQLTEEEQAFNRHLRQAIKYNFPENTQCIVDFLNCGGDPNKIVDENYDLTLLSYACLRENSDVVQHLIAAGANVQAVDYGKMTPLMNASSYKLICAMLIGAGASLHPKNCFGKTVLHLAAVEQKEATCELFINHQKNCDKGIITALLFFKHHENQFLRVIYREKLLKRHLENYTLKALLNARDEDGKYAYDYLKLDFLKPAGYQEPEDPLAALLSSFHHAEQADLDIAELFGDLEKIWHHT